MPGKKQSAALKPVKHFVLYKDEHYNSFPNIVKNDDGRYVAGFRQAPDRRTIFGHNMHIDPSSKAVTVSSLDGEQWDGRAQVLYDDYFVGVQDPCLNRLSDGTIFATFFTWKVLDQSDVPNNMRLPHDRQIQGKWIARINGSFSIRSFDGGKTWDEPLPIAEDRVIRGNIVELDDGTILLPTYCTLGGTSRVIVMKTEDSGKSWTSIAEIKSGGAYHFHEPNLIQTPSGKIVCLIRSLKKDISQGEEKTASPLFISESFDHGLTWSEPAARPYYSPSPFHALKLQEGGVLLTYGYRMAPYGIRAVWLDSECERWDEAKEFIIRDDGLGPDIGYTSSIQREDGSVIITYYYFDQTDRLCYIAGTLCEWQ